MSNERPMNPFIEYALRLQGDRVGENQKNPTLQVDVIKNVIWLKVYTGGKDGDGRNEQIPAKMDANTFGAMMSALEFGINAEPGWREGYRCYVPRKRQPGDTGFPKLLAATCVVGKDKEGKMFISVVRKDPPHIKFIFRPARLHEVVGMDNNILDAATTSQRYAASWIKIITPLVTHLLATQVHDFRDEQNNNGGGNGGYRNNNGGGNNNNNSGSGGSANDSFDDDIPL